MLQIAAMGNPNDPVVAYRVSYMKMMNAIKKRNEKVAEDAGKECEKIARATISKDEYWIAQLVAVNLTLGNDKMGYKKYDEAYLYADKSFEAAAEAEALIGKKCRIHFVHKHSCSGARLGISKKNGKGRTMILKPPPPFL